MGRELEVYAVRTCGKFARESRNLSHQVGNYERRVVERMTGFQARRPRHRFRCSGSHVKDTIPVNATYCVWVSTLASKLYRESGIARTLDVTYVLVALRTGF